jgi:hypothetical protein
MSKSLLGGTIVLRPRRLRSARLAQEAEGASLTVTIQTNKAPANAPGFYFIARPQ